MASQKLISSFFKPKEEKGSPAVATQATSAKSPEPSSSSPTVVSGAKRPALTSAPAAGSASAVSAKKPKAVSSAAASLNAWRTVKIEGIKGAEYQDQSLDWCTLPDGRELLLCSEIWHVPEKGTKPVQVPNGQIPGVCPYFAVVRDFPLYALVEQARTYGPNPTSRTSVIFRSLPDNVEVGRVVMPGDPTIKGLASCERAGGLALTDGSSLWFITAEPRASSSAAAGPTAAYDFRLHGAFATGGAGSRLRLFVDPPSRQRYAVIAGASGVLGGEVRVFRLTLQGEAGAGASSASSSAAAAGGAGALECIRSIEMHNPMRKSDKEAWVAKVALWTHPTTGAVSAVSVGCDGDCAVAILHDGKRVVSEGGYKERSWHCTSNGSGGSKGYPYAPAHVVAACPGVGVAFTGTQFEPVGHLWDILTDKVSPAGKLLTKTPKLAQYMRGPGKVQIMTCAFAPSGRVLAYVNSNDADDDTLKLVWPVGK